MITICENELNLDKRYFMKKMDDITEKKVTYFRACMLFVMCVILDSLISYRGPGFYIIAIIYITIILIPFFIKNNQFEKISGIYHVLTLIHGLLLVLVLIWTSVKVIYQLIKLIV